MTARRLRDGSHVHLTTDRLGGAQLFPRSPGHGYAAGLLRGLRLERLDIRPETTADYPGGQSTAVRSRSAKFEPVVSLEGVPSLVQTDLHHSVSLAGPGSSGGAGPSRRCRGCSPPPPASSGSGCPQPRRAAGPARWWPFHPTWSYDASWRTQPRALARCCGGRRDCGRGSRTGAAPWPRATQPSPGSPDWRPPCYG